MRHLHGPAHGLLGRAQVPQIPLEVEDPGPGHEVVVDVGGAERGGDPEVGRHRPLGVAGDEHQAAARAQRLGINPGIDGRVGRGRLEGDPGPPDVVDEDLAEQVAGHLADEARRDPPRAATPATVLAADPPETSMAGPMAW